MPCQLIEIIEQKVIQSKGDKGRPYYSSQHTGHSNLDPFTGQVNCY